MSDQRPLLEVKGLKKHFPLRGGVFGGTTGYVYAVDGVTFSVNRGETLSLVGESGCGKSTVGKALLRLIEPTAGEVYLDGQRIDNIPLSQLRPLRRRIQIVFQDPFSSLNPRMRVRDILAEPIINFGLTRNRGELNDRVAALMDKVQLPRDAINRFPHEFSGGQRQRIGIARALAPESDVIICDEAVSALDVSVKAQIVNLLSDLQDELRPDSAVHQPRPGDRGAPDAPRRRDVSRQAGGDRRPAHVVRLTQAPLHAGAAVRGAGARPDGEAGPHHLDRGCAQPHQPAQRLPFPHPLPLRIRPLPGGGAAAAGAWRRAEGGLPPGRACRS